VADALGLAELRLLDETPQLLESQGGGLTASVVVAPSEYVAGEDTAALEVIEGRDAIPRSRPPFPSESGLWGAPTAVFNVETLAALPAIVLHGGAWYRGLTGADEGATLLATLGPELRAPGVHEVLPTTTLRALVEEIGGGLRSGEPIGAVLPGGPSSGFLCAEELEIALDRDALAAVGSSLGCAVVRVYADGDCMACALREQLSFLAGACCGACPPCRMETSMLVRLLDQIRAGGPAALIGKLEEVVAFARDKGGRCSVIGMPVLPLSSVLARFPDDFAHHAEFGRCKDRPKREDQHVGSPGAQAQVRI
jgi:NADH:ubiquinone oxidoreductase subunit F (NADH-binding)